MTTDEILFLIVLFALRVINNAIGTIRMIVTANGRRNLALGLAFLESLIFAYAAGKVLTDLENIPKMLTYAAGFAVGGYVGIMIEEKFVTGYSTVNIISTHKGHDIAVKLREEGFGVTEAIGEGGQGSVTMLICVVLRQDAHTVIETARQIDEKVFVTIEAARTAQRGYVRSIRTHFR